MSAILDPPASARSIAMRASPRDLAGVLRRWWVRYTTWRVERFATARLSAMSDRELEDIGIVRSQIGFPVGIGSARHPGHLIG